MLPWLIFTPIAKIKHSINVAIGGAGVGRYSGRATGLVCPAFSIMSTL